MKTVLNKINELADLGLIAKYSIGGGIACTYYIEPTVTYDVVMVILSKEENIFEPLKYIYIWAEKNKFQLKGEHIIIDSVPVQFLPAHNELIKEAVTNAREIIFYEIKTFIFEPEYLIAIMLDTFRMKDKIRANQILEEISVNKELLFDILKRYNLTEKYKLIM